MIFDLHLDSAVPIHEQIVSQVIYAIASGSLGAGSMLPSVRKLAEQLLVNPNTVARAFQELERRGIVVARRGKGMEVTANGPAICHRQRQEIVREHIRNALREAAMALPEGDIRQLIEEELAKTNGRFIPQERD